MINGVALACVMWGKWAVAWGKWAVACGGNGLWHVVYVTCGKKGVYIYTCVCENCLVVIEGAGERAVEHGERERREAIGRFERAE